MVLLVFLGGVVFPGLLGIWYVATPNIVTAKADAGHLKTIIGVHDAIIVQTTTGAIAVSGTLSAPRGSALVIEKSTKRGERLCVRGAPGACVGLANIWAGPMQTVRHPWFAFNFHRLGIAGYKLIFWLAIGTFTTMLGLVVASAASGETRAQAQRSEATP